MISFPIWRNERMLNSLADPLNYYITFNDATIYSGRAHVRPGGYNVEIPIDRIIRDYIENTMDVEYDGVYGQPGNYGVFNVYQTGTDTLLAEYGVLLNCQDEWSGQTMVLADTVNGHLDPRMRFFWSKYNTGQTTEVITTEDIYYFNAESAVTVAWDAGVAIVNVNTNYPYAEIHAVCPEGVRELRYGEQYMFEVPINENPYAPADYTVEWYRRGVLLGTTVITVEAQDFYFYCDPTAVAGMDGDEFTIGIRTNYLPADIRVVLPSGWTLVSLTNRECVIQTSAGGIGNYNVYFYDTDDNLLGTTIVTVNEGYFNCPATFRIGNEGGQFTIPISTNISPARLSAIVPTGLTFVSISKTAVVLTASQNLLREEVEFEVKFYRDGSALLGTTTVVQNSVDWFEAPPEVGVPYIGGDVAIGLDTNYDLSTVTVVTQSGATLVEKGSGYVIINVPSNMSSADVPYLVQFYRNGELLGSTNVVVGVMTADKYLTVEAISGGTIEFHPETVAPAYRYANVQFDYRKNGGQWTNVSVSFYRNEYPTVVTLTEVSAGDKVEFRANDISYQTALSGIPMMSIVATAEAKVYGNIMSMFYGDDFEGKTTLPHNVYDYQRFKWFANYLSNLYADAGTKIVDAKNLYFPVQTVPKNVFSSMFDGCDMLVTGPMLQTTTFTDDGFHWMFHSCTKLQNVAIMPASGLTMSPSCFDQMYARCTSLTYVPYIPAGQFAERCFEGTFQYCSSLEKVASFPSSTVTDHCFMRTFEFCSKLRSVPTLPSTTAASYCYYEMFKDCESLRTPPALPATSLAPLCYYRMFQKSGIETAPVLPATVMADTCYGGMFTQCDNLTVPPVLPSMSLARYCYSGMFSLSGILTAPVLPATTLEEGCYEAMFSGTKITTAPALPATTLKKSCYHQMFNECKELVNAPELKASTLVTDCYRAMFQYCSKLRYIKCLATNPSSSYTYRWVASVYGSGTFVRKSGASWSSGVSGIPDYWTVEVQ